LCLHGAGGAERRNFDLVRGHLQARGIDSCAFDFLGHGETGGAMAGSSLAERAAQSLAVIAARGLPTPLKLVAASMGAHTAIGLTARLPVAALVLIVPAVYAAAAERAPFGAPFRDLIRQPDSWMASRAWGHLARFGGRLLVVAGECDPVIPRGVTERIFASAVGASRRRLYVAPGTSHRVLTDLRARDPDALAGLLDLMVETLA
jgi:hypothetical protein